MLADTTGERADLDEQYIAATNTSDLTVDPDRRGAADHLIAAGLAANRVGGLLKHLRAVWDVWPKPAPWTDADVAARAETVLTKKGKPDTSRARAQIIVEYAAALQQAYMRLPGRMDVLAVMAEWARRRDWDVEILSVTLFHHLDSTCRVCLGCGHERRYDAQALGKKCYACGGEGKRVKPLEADRILRWLKGCEGREKGDRAGLLSGSVTSDDVTLMADRLRGEPEAEDSPEEAARIAALFQFGNKGLRRG